MTDARQLIACQCKQEHISQQRNILVLGGAVGDKLFHLDNFPTKGGDVCAQEGDQQLGGCALNIVRLLARLHIALEPILIAGTGIWGEKLKACLESFNLRAFHTSAQDNGWCITLISPDGERSFINIMGAENNWDEVDFSRLTVTPQDILYVSGYELFSPQAHNLRSFLRSLPTHQTILYDLGPMCCDILDEQFCDMWLKPGAILTLNDKEFQFLKPAQKLSSLEEHRLPHALIHRCGALATGLYESPRMFEQAPRQKLAYPISLVDTVGAGDAHAAGVLAGLAYNLDLLECIDFGNALAALTCTHCGADAPVTWQALDQLLSDQSQRENISAHLC